MRYNAQQRRAYGEGLRAGKARLDTIACPYKANSDSGVSWFNGYSAGKGSKPAYTPDYSDMAYEDQCAAACGVGL